MNAFLDVVQLTALAIMQLKLYMLISMIQSAFQDNNHYVFYKMFVQYTFNTHTHTHWEINTCSFRSALRKKPKVYTGDWAV
jgi:hypothetical protein